MGATASIKPPSSLHFKIDNVQPSPASQASGVLIALDGSCVSIDYGSSACLQHVLLHDPNCQKDPSTTAVLPWCFQTWCFADVNSSRKNSVENIYRTNYFSPQADIFYSYSTCYSTDYFWQQQLESSAVGGIEFSVAIPGFQNPTMVKELTVGMLEPEIPLRLSKKRGQTEWPGRRVHTDGQQQQHQTMQYSGRPRRSQYFVSPLI